MQAAKWRRQATTRKRRIGGFGASNRTGEDNVVSSFQANHGIFEVVWILSTVESATRSPLTFTGVHLTEIGAMQELNRTNRNGDAGGKTSLGSSPQFSG